MADIHGYKRRLERTLERIRTSSEISDHNKKLLEKYYQTCVLESLSVAKTERYVYDALRLALYFKKDFDKATEEDLKTLVTNLENKDWSPHTKYTFKIGLRKLYKMIDGITEKGVSPERLKWMKTNLKKYQTRLPEDLINEKDVEGMIRYASRDRDKALIACLYESGCRIGELCSLRIKDIRFDEKGAVLQVFGKTGSRIVRIVQSVPYLLTWLNRHPSREREDFVWISEKSQKLLTDSRISIIIKACAKKAGIKKRVWCHGFRHARATCLAGYLTESQMKTYLGWTQGSEMAGIYVHLNGKDLDKAIMKMNGVEVNEKEDTNEQFKMKECIRCKMKNELTNKFCKRCGFVLDKEEAQKVIKEEAQINQADEIMNQLVNDPEILNLIRERLKLNNKNKKSNQNFQ